MLAPNNQYKTINLGSPGISAETILMNTLKYINLFGKPKNIISLFPDPYRLCFIHDKNFHVSKYLPLDKTVYPTDKELNNLKLGSHEDSIIIKQKYLKLPFELNDFISPHFAIYKTIQSIYILQEFCKQNNINFVWSTWNHNFSKLLNYSFESDKDFMLDKNNYIHFGQGSILEDKTCNDDHGSEFKNHQCWNQGSDISIHPGIHYQIHVYELFKDRIIK